jgi:hypothetical protein
MPLRSPECMTAASYCGHRLAQPLDADDWAVAQVNINIRKAMPYAKISMKKCREANKEQDGKRPRVVHGAKPKE